MDPTTPRPVYLVAPGPLGPALRSAFPAATVVASADDLRPLRGREPGVVVVERPAVPAEAALVLAEEAAAVDGTWAVVLARTGSGGVEIRPLSVGWPTAPDELARWASTGGVEGTVPELRAVLSRLARARHDINNPLTSAMAETQLLLMDAEADGEMREALETVQTQLRRIRDMVADLRAFRPPA